MTAQEALNILDLQSPFSAMELKSAHKNALVTWFPAQFMSDRAQLTKALDQTARIHEAYDLLLPLADAEKRNASNALIEEATRLAYGGAPAAAAASLPVGRADVAPASLPHAEPQAPATPEPPRREEPVIPASLAIPTAWEKVDAPSEPSASPSSKESDLRESKDDVASPASNPFLQDIVPLKTPATFASEGPKVELRGKSTPPPTPAEPASPPPPAPTSDVANTSSSNAPVVSRMDPAIKVRPPKVIISPRLRGAAVQSSMSVATVPVPLPPIADKTPNVAPPVSVPAPVPVPVIAPVTPPAPVVEPVAEVKAEPVVAPVPVPLPKEEVKPVMEAPVPAPIAEKAPAPAPVAGKESVTVPVPESASVSPASSEAMPVVEVPKLELKPVPAVEAKSEPVKVSPPEVVAAEPVEAVKDVAPVAKSPVRTPILTPATVPAAEPALAPAPTPAPAPAAVPVEVSTPEPVSAPEAESVPAVEESEVSPAAPVPVAAPTPPAEASASAEALAPVVVSHVSAAHAEEASAAETASHHGTPAPAAAAVGEATAAPPHAHAHSHPHPSTAVPAAIARPTPPAKAKSENGAAGDDGSTDEPAGDHALVPALGDRYHPAEKEGNPNANTDTSRHFPARPVAPSGNVAVVRKDEDAEDKGRTEERLAEVAQASGAGKVKLSAGQHVLRFFLGIISVAAVGYGIYWVSQTEIGKDPWGMKPGSGGPGERINLAAFNSLKEAAENGNAAAQMAVARAYMRGDDVVESPEEAVKWFRKAADQGEPDAQYAMGDAYKSGAGVPQDNAEALKWYRMAEASREERKGSAKKEQEKEPDTRLQ